MGIPTYLAAVMTYLIVAAADVASLLVIVHAIWLWRPVRALRGAEQIAEPVAIAMGQLVSRLWARCSARELSARGSMVLSLTLLCAARTIAASVHHLVR